MGLTEIILDAQQSPEILEYLESNYCWDLRKEIPPKKSERSRRAGEIIRKFGLEFMVFMAVTDYKAQEEITSKGTDAKPGCADYVDLAYLLSGRVMTSGEIRAYFLELAIKNDIPELTEESRRYIGGFDIEYVKEVPVETLKERVPIFRKPVKKPENYGPFLKELHKKVKKDKVLQYEMLKKWAGTDKHLTYAGSESILGYSKLKSLAAFFTGEVMNDRDAGRYLNWLLRTKGGIVKTENLSEIIMGFKNTDKASYAAKAVNKHTRSLSPEEVRSELPLHNHGRLVELSKKILRFKLGYILFLAATGYEKQREITQRGGDKPGYNSLTALAHLLSGEKKDIIQTGRYFKELAVKNEMPH